MQEAIRQFEQVLTMNQQLCAVHAEKLDQIALRLEQIDQSRESSRDRLEEIHQSVVAIKTVLLGANGHRGLATVVERHEKQIQELLTWKTRVLGIAIGVGAAGGIGGVKLLEWMIK